MTNYIAVSLPLYTPFDYSFPPYREYIPLLEIEQTAPRPRKVLPFYREIVILLESDANEFIATLNQEGETAVITCLADFYDNGNGTRHTIQPWGKNDKVFRDGPYVLVVNLYLPSISLYRIE